MCGIVVAVGKESTDISALKKIVDRRGPDVQGDFEMTLQHFSLQMHCSVLGMRGNLTPQPSENSHTVLAFNGEIFGGLSVSGNDTQSLSDAFFSNHCNVFEVIAKVKGPFAFCLFDKMTLKLWFGRDYFGRRSLLLKRNENQLILTSASESSDFDEVKAAAVFCVDFNDPNFNIQQFDYKYWTEISRSFCDRNVLDEFHSVLLESVRKRAMCRNGRLGVLFSGGLDSIVIAALTDSVLDVNEPVDLITVAFESRKGQCSVAPDRITAIAGLKELQEISKRQWNLVCVDVSSQENDLFEEYIRKLMLPNNTVMDLSIAKALWFAARAHGKLLISSEESSNFFFNDSSTSYISPARVLLCGMGADEQLGGYSRHKSSFERSRDDLLNELQLDVDRISQRNLGRDDRVISDSGKEARFPFLDEDVVAFLCSLSVEQKMDLNLPRGTGDKKLLRQLAKKIGLTFASELPKRAIQFGAKTAKMRNAKEEGGDLLL